MKFFSYISLRGPSENVEFTIYLVFKSVLFLDASNNFFDISCQKTSNNVKLQSKNFTVKLCQKRSDNNFIVKTEFIVIIMSFVIHRVCLVWFWMIHFHFKLWIILVRRPNNQTPNKKLKIDFDAKLTWRISWFYWSN